MALVDEIERLRDRVEELEALLGVGWDDIASYRNALRLTVDQAKILGLLAKRNVTVTRDAIYTVLYGARPDCDQPDMKIIDVHVCKLRKPLRRVGVEIQSDWGMGYYLLAADKRKLRDQVALAAANGGKSVSGSPARISLPSPDAA